MRLSEFKAQSESSFSPVINVQVNKNLEGRSKSCVTQESVPSASSSPNDSILPPCHCFCYKRNLFFFVEQVEFMPSRNLISTILASKADAVRQKLPSSFLIPSKATFNRTERCGQIKQQPLKANAFGPKPDEAPNTKLETESLIVM